MLTAEQMLNGYGEGIFPMAESRDDDALHWVDPRRRGIFPLDGFHISGSLARRIRREPHEVRIDTRFSDVVHACADRAETWINDPLMVLYDRLHQMGHAHSVEVWEEEHLTGGVFGVTLGGAFFGESMFSRTTDASKIALAYLMDRLNRAGFTLFDAQFLTPHLKSLGAIEVSRGDYQDKLRHALKLSADFMSPGDPPGPYELMQRRTQMSYRASSSADSAGLVATIQPSKAGRS
jgi:leucyl/phenylalanyl-tRNA---protein transferase